VPKHLADEEGLLVKAERNVTGEAGATRVLGWAYVAVGVVAAVTTAMPFSATAPTPLNAVLATVALLLGVGLLRTADRVSPVQRNALLVGTSLAMTACLVAATTDVGRVVTSYEYLWLAMYSAWFHPRRWVGAHGALMGGGLAAALALSGAPSPVQTWFFVMSSVAGVGAVLHVLAQRLRQLAEQDPLTGVLNRRAFTDAVDAAMRTAARSGEPLTLVLIDLDDFKLVNDSQGHAAGDALLAELAATWQRGIRPRDVLGRLGGDEFALALPGTDEAGATALVDRLRAAGAPGRWTAGTAPWRGDPLQAWMHRADQDLYHRKRSRHRSPTARGSRTARADHAAQASAALSAGAG
jgi:diguanylate cyclase (GGDEF)-like protein